MLVIVLEMLVRLPPRLLCTVLAIIVGIWLFLYILSNRLLQFQLETIELGICLQGVQVVVDVGRWHDL